MSQDHVARSILIRLPVLHSHSRMMIRNTEIAGSSPAMTNGGVLARSVSDEAIQAAGVERWIASLRSQ
jgi:hypothetical protein